jgi:hypothetical protein
MNRSKQILWVNLVVGIAALSVFAGCGHSLGPTTSNDSSVAQDGTPVKGVGGFGSQCPYGIMGDPIPLKLTAAGCPLDSNADDKSFHLNQPLLPIILQADCKKMEITARTTEGYRIENRWNALPDGRFYFVMDAGNAALGTNGARGSNCETTTTIEVNGLMKCKDRDHVQIEVDSTWHLGQTMPGTEPHYNGTQCGPLKGCDLHGFTTLNQCG